MDWLRSVSPYGVIRPQWVNSLWPSEAIMWWHISGLKIAFVSQGISELTHWGRVTYIYTWPAPSHYLNQCWNIVNSNLRIKIQWNLERDSYTFIQENVFQNVCEMVAILPQPLCVNHGRMLSISSCQIHVCHELSKLTDLNIDFCS